MKKQLLAAAFALYMTGTAFSQKNIDISFRQTLGFSYAQFDESVYASEGYRCSLLEWEAKPFLNAGGDFSFKKDRLEFSAAFNMALPTRCGKMRDYDWTSGGTNYSYTLHDNHAMLNFDIYTSADYSFIVLTWLNLGFSAALDYSYNSFESKNGKGRTGKNAGGTGSFVPWNDESARDINVYGVQYYRNSVHTFLGLRSDFFIGKRFSICARAYASPFTFIHSTDHHLGSEGGFFMGGIQYAPFSTFKWTLDLSHSLKKKLALSVGIGGLHLKSIKGTLYSDYYDGKMTAIDQEYGSSLFRLNFYTGARFSLN